VLVGCSLAGALLTLVDSLPVVVAGLAAALTVRLRVA
jgi:hypothetical protein